MDTPAMVRKIAILLATGIIVVFLAVAVLRLTQGCNINECRESRSVSVADATKESQAEPLTDEEAEECFRAFKEIENAYSNLGFEAMQEIFQSVSNNVARLGKDRLYTAISPLDASFRGRFWRPDVKALDFSDVSEFDRFIRANVAAAHIIGYAIVANDFSNSLLLHYDMVVFNGISDYLKLFNERKSDELAASAQALLDEWKDHMASGQSVTRMYLRMELKFFLQLPRWRAEDLGVKSENDWIVYMRNHALKFHKQCYDVEPKWLDEDFPLPQDGDDGKARSGNGQSFRGPDPSV